MSYSYSSYGSSSSYSSYSSSSTFNHNNSNSFYRGTRRNRINGRNHQDGDNAAASKKYHEDPNSLHQQALLFPSTSQTDMTRAASITAASTTSTASVASTASGTNNNSSNGDHMRRRRGTETAMNMIDTINSKDLSGNYKMNHHLNNTVIESSPSSTSSSQQQSSTFKITIVVILWYVLGVVSISTTKIILRDYGSNSDNNIGKIQISPLGITLQQLFIGSIFLKLWTLVEPSSSTSSKERKIFLSLAKNTRTSTYYLTLTSIFFTLGFLFTNYSFSKADPTFVETIKASEPMTSAFLAYLYKIERLSVKEINCLVSICVGVLISTLGNANPNDSTTNTIEQAAEVAMMSGEEGDFGSSTTGGAGEGDIMISLMSSGIVMCSNLCFSFRGLYQKLYRNSITVQSSSSSSSSLNNNGSMDENQHNAITQLTDNQLQLRVHQIGVLVMTIPFCILESPLTSLSRLMVDSGDDNVGSSGDLFHAGALNTYMLLAFVNAFAFTHYNLASSYVLTRISVVHHAALNCLRRLFAIVMTSIIFGVPITFVAGVGIFVSIVGFIGFTYYKMQRKKVSKLILPR